MVELFQDRNKPTARKLRIPEIKKGSAGKSSEAFWNQRHWAAIFTVGRNGKDHNMAFGSHTWNRKGRW